MATIVRKLSNKTVGKYLMIILKKYGTISLICIELGQTLDLKKCL